MDAKLSRSVGVIAIEGLPEYCNNARSFEDLYRNEYPALFAFARAWTGDRSASEDLVQDTMVRAFVHWGKVQRYHRPGAWCLRVLSNACRGRARRRLVEQRYLARQRSDVRVTSGPSVEVVAFWDAVRRLPERPRMVVALYYAADRSVDDIASIVNVPVGTVTSDLTRARAVLMAAMER